MQTHVVDKVTKTAKCQDEKVNLLKKLALPWLVGIVEIIVNTRSQRHCKNPSRRGSRRRRDFLLLIQDLKRTEEELKTTESNRELE